MNLDNIVLLLLFLDNGPQLDAREVFSDKSSWTDAMKFCLEKGGRPASYSDLLRRQEKEITRIHEVWTADYGVLPAKTQNRNDTVLSDVLYHECGYTIIDTLSYQSMGGSLVGVNKFSKYVTTLTTKGEQYFDTCTSRRSYICSGKAIPVIYPTQLTLSEANESCLNENMTLIGNVSLTGQSASIFPSDDQLQQPLEVWTNDARSWHLRIFTCHLDEEQIEKVGVYGHNESFRLVDLKRETKLSSICLYADNTYREPLYPSGDNGFFGRIQVFLPPACMIFVAVISSLIACYLVRRERREEISPPFASFTKRKTRHTMTGVVYENTINGAEPTCVEIVCRDNTAELGQVAQQSVTEAYITADVANLVEIQDHIPNSAEENVYDNKDFATPSSNQHTVNLYDRANFQDGEPLYD